MHKKQALTKLRMVINTKYLRDTIEDELKTYKTEIKMLPEIPNVPLI